MPLHLSLIFDGTVVSLVKRKTNSVVVVVFRSVVSKSIRWYTCILVKLCSSNTSYRVRVPCICSQCVIISSNFIVLEGTGFVLRNVCGIKFINLT